MAKRQPDLSVLMENVHKPHNFAAVMRTCDAVGVLDTFAVIKSRDPTNITATASSADKWVRLHRFDAIQDVARVVRERGMKIVAAHLSNRAVDFRSYDYTQPTAILLGQELDGVTEEALALVDQEVVIPMAGVIASLNVSVAAATILYEAQRQREAAGMYKSPRITGAKADALLFEYLHPQVAEHYAKRNEPYPPIDDEGHVVF